MRCAVDLSFNRITIDGDTSTNDTVIVMSNGQADAPRSASGSRGQIFRCALHKVMLELAKMIVGDGERVTKFVEIRVRNARTQADARRSPKPSASPCSSNAPSMAATRTGAASSTPSATPARASGRNSSTSTSAASSPAKAA
jgi:hypothetical protein